MVEDRITNDEYTIVQDQLLMLARLVRGLPLTKFLTAISLAETTGPMLDPTLYKKAMGNLEEIKCMAQGALKFQQALPQLCPQCKVRGVAYRGAKYCGAGCSARAEETIVSMDGVPMGNVLHFEVQQCLCSPVRGIGVDGVLEVVPSPHCPVHAKEKP